MTGHDNNVCLGASVDEVGRLSPPKRFISSLNTFNNFQFPSLDNTPKLPPRQRSFEKKRRVHFAECANVWRFAAPDKSLYEELYWSRADILAIQIASKREGKLYAKDPKLMDSLLRLHRFLRIKGRGTLSVVDDETALEALAVSNCRGLEHFMTSLISRHRLWAKSKVLKAASELDLRQVSLKTSSISLAFAQRMALVDARAVRREPEMCLRLDLSSPPALRRSQEEEPPRQPRRTTMPQAA